jgi:integrase
MAAAGGNSRDSCILMIFFQTGVRVSELCAVRLDDIDLPSTSLMVRAGKGMSARTIELEKRAARRFAHGWRCAR